MFGSVRSALDQYGLDFMKGGAPPPGAGGAGGFPGGFQGFPGGGGGGGPQFSFQTNGGGGGPGGFQFGNAADIFSMFMGSGGMGEDSNMFSSFGGGGMPGGMGGMPGGMGGMPGGFPGAQTRPTSGARGSRRAATPEASILERPLPITLEDLFKGTTKKLKINRRVFDPNTHQQSTEEKILTVPIKAGLKAGSKVKFAGAGDQTADGGTQDIHFIVSEKPHELFTRDGDDLRRDVEISLKEALTGWKKTVTTIDGKQLSVGGSGPTAPTWTERFPSLGMPSSKKPTERGDFIVGVNIKFPTSLSADQKKTIKEIL
jgi:DnaJ family protein B protein 4